MRLISTGNGNLFSLGELPLKKRPKSQSALKTFYALLDKRFEERKNLELVYDELFFTVRLDPHLEHFLFILNIHLECVLSPHLGHTTIL